MSAAIDTLALARKLRDQAHFTQEQAEGVAEAINEVMADRLATKDDLKNEIAAVRSEMKAEFAAVRSEMKAEFAAVRGEMKAEFAAVRGETRAEIAALRAEIELAKRDLKIWLGSVGVVITGILLAAIRYLPQAH